MSPNILGSNDLTKEQEEALVVAMLDDLDSIGEMFHQTVNLWKAGAAGALAKLMNEEMDVMPELAETLLFQRNRNWIENAKQPDPAKIGAPH